MAQFLSQICKIPIYYNCIYVKRKGNTYEFIAAFLEYNEDINLHNEIQPEELKKYRLWSVDYLSVFYKWIHEEKLVNCYDLDD